MNKAYDEEEEFHDRDRKMWKKERKRAQKTDRSKFKKTDLKKKGGPLFDPDWEKATVISITKEGIWIDISGKIKLTSLTGLLKKEKTSSKNLVAVGDRVRLNSSGAITFIDERTSFLARSDISGNKEQLIAVNVDQGIVTLSVCTPPLKPSLVDRYLIALKKGNIEPVIVINKIDLLDDAEEKEKALYKEFLLVYEQLGVTILSISIKEQIGLDALKTLLHNKISVFSGQSGVGKSSILNALYGLGLKTGELAVETAKGSHTTSKTELLPLPGGGFCVDTPGIRSFALWKLQKEDVIEHFNDLQGLGCKYQNCLHLNEPGCVVLEKMEAKEISNLRYQSYRSLIDEALGKVDNRGRKKQ